MMMIGNWDWMQAAGVGVVTVELPSSDANNKMLLDGESKSDVLFSSDF
jgi:hypothetical protein